MKNINEHFFNNRTIKGEEVNKEYADSLNTYLDEFKEHIFDEIKPIEKSKDDLFAIRKYNEYLREEMKELGLEYAPLPDEKIQLYNPSDFFTQNDHASGLYFPQQNIIAIANLKWEKYPSLMHEMVHAASFHRFELDKQPPTLEDKADYKLLRVGYNAEREGDKEERFYGFNEGVTEIFSKEILNKHKTELIQNLPLLKNADPVFIKEFFTPSNYNYHAFIKLLLHRLSEETGKPQSDFWQNFKKGMMTGNLMHLREIEEVFGKGSLRIMSMHSNKKNNIEISKYFLTKNPEEKNELFQKIMEEAVAEAIN